ncbi:MAG: RtcB family protein [Myxococcales bacterium]|nr:RtcB family protein [Myxococcales bacterium]
MKHHYEVYEGQNGRHIKAWTRGVPFDEKARRQVLNVTSLPFVAAHVAVMPDVHVGIGATVGSVIATAGAIIPAAVGVDIGCGMVAARLNLRANDLPDSLAKVRSAIEAAVPHGRSDHGGRNDDGAWRKEPPAEVMAGWAQLAERHAAIVKKHPKCNHPRPQGQLGTLGTGNHFIELCLDERDDVWVMLHSGSRGQGNAIGSRFIALAQEEMKRFFINLPDRDLAYLAEGSEHFADYIEAVGWAQDYARINRAVMLARTIEAVNTALGRNAGQPIVATEEAVNCHHNYVARENHFGKDLLVTRKGAVRAGTGELGIIPGSMGARSFIVRGKGNPDSYCSCSHGAGRVLSRTEAKKRYTTADQVAATAGIECRKDEGVIDEIPMAYKDIDAVMAAQSDLVEIVHTLRQVVCVKG